MSTVAAEPAKKSGFLRAVVLLAGGTAAGHIVTIAVTPILSRLYSPEDFGVLAIYVSILATVSAVSSLRYELAVPIPSSSREGAAVLLVTLIATGITSAATSIGIVATYGLRGPSFLGDWWYLAWLLIPGMLLTSLYRAFSYWSVRAQDYSTLAKTKVRQAAGQAGTQVGLGFFSVGYWGLLIGYIVGQSAGISTLFRRFKAEGIHLDGISRTEVLSAAHEYRHFALISSWSSLANSAGLYAPALLFSGAYGAAAGGLYAFAERIVSMPIKLVGGAIAQVYFGRAARLRNQPVALQKLYRGLILRLSLIGVVPVIVLALTAPPIFAVIFGEEWGEAGVVVRMLSFWLLAKFVAFPVSQTLEILGRQGAMAVWNVSRLACVVATILWMHQMAYDYLAAVTMFSLVAGALYVVLVLYTDRLIVSMGATGA